MGRRNRGSGATADPASSFPQIHWANPLTKRPIISSTGVSTSPAQLFAIRTRLTTSVPELPPVLTDIIADYCRLIIASC
jgi:hypothetical protein